MNYWDYRKKLKDIIPRLSVLKTRDLENEYKQKEKGRKKNYSQFNIASGQYDKLERLLNTEQINSFLEVSLRAQSCPMPLNIDAWDGLTCPYKCKYCFADYFRSSLYTSFFDNGKDMGLRYCNTDFYKTELDKIFKVRGEKVSGEDKILNAIRLQIPIRLGIRFEDFTKSELKHGVSLSLLQHLQKHNYPTMINTKSDILSTEPYLRALADNKGRTAVHSTIISSDDTFLKVMEPGAPTFKARIASMKILQEAGIQVVARIEPWMIFINDSRTMVDDYIAALKWAGIKYMTFDSYSYSARSFGIAQNFHDIGFDFNRMFLLSSDSQAVSSFMLGKFMEYFREAGLSCSTFDQGNVPDNDDWICCSVGDWFEKAGMNWGSGVIAIKWLKSLNGSPGTWDGFVKYVEGKGGFLSTELKNEVHNIWNSEGDAAWHMYWGRGIQAVGNDESGNLVWKYIDRQDFRKQIIEELL